MFIISGCDIRNKDKNINDESWKDETLVMDDCGSDGLKCCVNKDVPCFFEQICCTDPNNSERNYCSDECSFGGFEEYCDIGNVCEERLACHNGDCVKCGESGNPCCVDGIKCLNENSEEKNRTQCTDNICELCGYGGNKICSGEMKCIKNHLENNNICLSCGEFNQPCCKIDQNKECDDNLKCELGFCVK